MKKIVLYLIIVLVVVAGIFTWLLAGSGTGFNENKKYLLVYSGKNDEASVMAFIKEQELVRHPSLFVWLTHRMSVWDRLKAGRFEIKKGESLLGIARMLRNNRQTPVKLVINKLRTKKDLASILSKNFEADSLDFVNYIYNQDSIRQLDVNENTFMTIVVPNTYTMYWNTSPGKIFKRLKNESDNFWQKNDRLNKAEKQGLTQEQVYTIASIVEEETNQLDEKGNVASVYINRYRTGMPLGADPTIKFALNDFSLKRIYEKHLQVESPYNTYRNRGLPPGPICTPSSKTIDAVLNAPSTDYLYFVARSDFSGHHTFSRNYTEHLQHAREYQKALDELILRKQQNASKSAL